MAKGKISVEEIRPSSQKKDRADAEKQATDGLRLDGHLRRRKGKTESMFFRVSPETRQQLFDLQARLSVGQPETVSLTITLEKALDALEATLEGKK